MVTKPNVQQLTQFTYDRKLLRYRQAGRFVKQEAVIDAVNTVIDAETERIKAISQQLVNGEINLAEWQLQTSALLKNLHVATGLVGAGGRNAVSASDLGFIANRIKGEYKLLRNFALQIKRGDVKLGKQLIARSALYTQAARGTYEEVVRRANKNVGNTLERRNLALADHCQGPTGCVALAAKGWQPIGTLPLIGDTPCMSNCKCSFSYKSA